MPAETTDHAIALPRAVDRDVEPRRDLGADPRPERLALGVADRAVAIGVDRLPQPRARDLAVEDDVGEADPIAERRQLQVAVVVVDRRRDVSARRGRERRARARARARSRAAGAWAHRATPAAAPAMAVPRWLRPGR